MMSSTLTEIDRLQKEINAFRPLPQNTLKQLKEYYRVGLTYTSNALEGNSLTETETKIVIEDGLTIGGKPMRDHYEALGHSEAYDYIHMLAQKQGFDENDVKTVHKMFYRRIDETQAGQYRNEKVFISGSKYTPPAPDKVPQLMKELIGNLSHLEKENHTVYYAALVHKAIAFIHPFIDGNGRVARLLMNLVLLQKGYLIAVIPPVLRLEYIQALEKAHAHDEDFKEFIARVILEAQKDYLRLLRG